MSNMRPAYSFIHNILTHLRITLLLSTLFHALSYPSLRLPLVRHTKLRATPNTVKEVVFYIHGWHRDPPDLTWGAADEDLEKAAAGAPEFIFKELSWRKQAHSYDVRYAQHNIWANTDNFQDNIINDIYEVLNMHPHTPFRLVGHSLGCQVVLKVTQRLIADNQLNKHYWPGRIALLEPAFVKTLTIKKVRESETSRERCMKLLEQLARNDIVIEIYRSSFLTRNYFIGHSNQLLMRTLPYPCIDINYSLSEWFNFKETHNGAKTFYFSTFTTPPHTICGSPMPHAASPTESVRHFYGKHFEQVVGGALGGRFMITSKDQAPHKCPMKSLLKALIQQKPSPPPLQQKTSPILFHMTKEQTPSRQQGVKMTERYKA